MSTHRFIERQRGQYVVRALCQVLGVAQTPTTDAWRQRRQRRLADHGAEQKLARQLLRQRASRVL